MHEIRFAFLGSTKFSQEILLFLLKNKFKPLVVFTIPEFFDISYSKGTKVKNYNYGSLKEICEEHQIPLHFIDSTNKTINDYASIIEELKLDLILVMGWYYMIPPKIRDLSKHGAWGIHASLLPDYAGGAPLVWAIINGEKRTGVSLFKLDNGVDDGDIISQQEISIDENDTIREVYIKATNASMEILVASLNDFPKIDYKPQDKSNLKIYPQRAPSDGELDLNKNSTELYNFIRAQSAPYPGAFIRTIDGKKLIIEKARIENEAM